MSLNGLPILPGQVLARDLNGHYFYVDATPDMVNNAMRLTQDLHASGQSRPKGDSATLADFLIDSPVDRSGPAFYRWATQNQLSPRKCIAMEIEASVHGMTFQPEGHARAWKPWVPLPYRGISRRCIRPLANICVISQMGFLSH